ncbi:MAG: hypothetical protein ACRDOU_17080 [Streptosporangiaceae bacterium]
MKRLTLTCAVVSVLLLIDGVVLELINYHPGDQNPFFGNQNLILSDGDVVLISAGLFALATALIWFFGLRRGAASRAGGPEPRSAEDPGRRTASRT